MIRLFVDGEFKKDQTLAVSVKQAHYLTHVMRLKVGEIIEIVNGHQGVWQAEIGLQKKQVFLKCLKQLQKQQNLPPCFLCPALIKKEAMDLILQKSTELGVTEIYPIMAEYSVVSQLNMERSKSIIREACEQCERMDEPMLHAPKKLAEVLELLKGKADIIWLSERGKNQGKESDLPAALFVGPEGGWSPMEQKLFQKTKAIEWHLGNTILRSETACIAGLSLAINKNK